MPSMLRHPDTVSALDPSVTDIPLNFVPSLPSASILGRQIWGQGCFLVCRETGRRCGRTSNVTQLALFFLPPWPIFDMGPWRSNLWKSAHGLSMSGSAAARAQSLASRNCLVFAVDQTAASDRTTRTPNSDHARNAPATARFQVRGAEKWLTMSVFRDREADG